VIGQFCIISVLACASIGSATLTIIAKLRCVVSQAGQTFLFPFERKARPKPRSVVVDSLSARSEVAAYGGIHFPREGAGRISSVPNVSSVFACWKNRS
jgi:hypothetical protein